MSESSTIASLAPGAEADAGGARAGERAAVRTSERGFALVVCALFLCVTVPVALRHELWRDEMQAWLLARDTASVAALLRQLRYEGHPALWYLLLRLFARSGAGVWTMQLVTLATGVATTWLFARFAPFPRSIRALFAFGYFVAYAYTIVARSYGVGMLLAIVVCVLLTRERTRPLACGAAMALLANVSVYGVILVIALALGIAATYVGPARAVPWPSSGRLVMLACAIVGVALSVVQLRPPADAAFHGAGLVVGDATHRFDAERLLPVWRALVPIPNVGTPADLNATDALSSRSPRATVLAIALSAVLVASAAWLMRRSRVALVFYLAATIGLLAFSVGVYPGALYHHGHFYLALVMGLWLARVDEERDTRPARGWLDDRADLLIGGLMLVQVAGGIVRLAGDRAYPYSGASDAASFLRERGLAAARIAVYPDYYGTTLSGYLGRPVIAVSRGNSATYMRLDLPRIELTDAQVLERLRACCVTPDSGAILVLWHPLAASDPTLRVVPLARFDRTIVDENYYLYDAHAVAPSRTP